MENLGHHMTPSNKPSREPAYLSLGKEQLRIRAEKGLARLASCTLCPRACRADRRAGPTGSCHTGRHARVSSYFPHMGEEAAITGQRGSGTIFFSGCNLACIYCQNHQISQGDDGTEVSDGQLAAIMLRLQAMGCHNVNLVSPSHVLPQFLAALALAVEKGFRLPIVYNSGGYDSVATLRLLDGIVDIYMPDAKYADDGIGRQLSGISNYPRVNRQSLKEMHRQVGDLQEDERGIAVRGLLIRHLVLPEGMAGTAEVARFIASGLSSRSYVNVMGQYHPCFQAGQVAALRRRITAKEYAAALAAARAAGLSRGFPED